MPLGKKDHRQDFCILFFILQQHALKMIRFKLIHVNDFAVKVQVRDWLKIMNRAIGILVKL